ncbi:MMPL family protein [Novipirellula aureliae]|uniref:MMPL family protein n=1 Tax=Novipirellula aureliae TaxID=2527966 RepID=A0A5C6DET7_9BACT|nr:MMPL family transporter [Novipirellula aureliae]TWU33646.1 MMPL family protein [Novipirellula aureliae]
MSTKRPANTDQRHRWPSVTVRWGSLILAFAVFPIVMLGAIRAWENSGTKVEDWLPAGFEETETLYQFYQRFGSDELLMIGWDGAKLGDPKIERLREVLLAADPLDRNHRVFFRDVWTGDSILEQMQAPPLALSRRQAMSRMFGWILGKEETTAMLALVSDAGMADRHSAIDFARRSASSVLELPIDEIHFAGSTIETVAIDEASQSSLLRLNGYSFLVCVGLLMICMRRIWYALVIFGIGLYNEQASMALMHYSGTQMDSILLLTANLALVLSVSAGIHMYGYYRHACQQAGDESPAWVALRTAFKPTLLAAITTGIGFGSLAISQIVPVHKFGLYTAITAPTAVLLTLWYLAMYFPASRKGLSGRDVPSVHVSLNPGSLAANESPKESAARWRWMSYWPIILSFFFVLAVVGAYNARRLRISTGMHDLFPDDAKLLGDYAWIEQRIGPLVPVEIVVEVPLRDDREIVDELRWVAELQRQLRGCEAVGSLISALNFTPPIPPDQVRQSVGDIAYRTGWSSGVNQSLDRFESLRFLRQESHQRLWRLTARVEGSIEQDYSAIMSELKAITAKTLKEAADPDVSFTISGGAPLAAKTQQRLLSDLTFSYFTALLLIAITLAIVLRNPIGSILAMFPNVIPALGVFGLMGAMGWNVEIGGVMTASAVLGIGVDDSMHLIMAFRDSFARHGSHQQAAIESLRTCAPAMSQTTLVCGLGMLVFALSPFVPIQRFAWLMASLLSVALLADLVLLPAILYSPLGKFFLLQKTRRTAGTR